MRGEIRQEKWHLLLQEERGKFVPLENREFLKGLSHKK